MAEAVRFELTNGSHRRQFSRLLPSTTRPRFLLHGIIHNHWPDEGVLTGATRPRSHAIPLTYPTNAQFSRNAFSNAYAGNGAAYKYPCTSSHPAPRKNANWSSVSTPSAITRRHNCRAMLMMVPAIAQSLPSAGIPIVNERSILSV